MDLILHSERLTLSPLAQSDTDMLIELFTDREVRKFTGGVLHKNVIRAQLTNWIRRGGNGCVGIWCISDTGTDEKLGTVALLPMPIEQSETDFSLVVPGCMPEGHIEVGYFLKRSAWGKGYATEACRRLVKMAFEQSPLTQIVATFDPQNSASKHVLEKVGFIHTGTMRSYGEDGPCYRVTRKMWQLDK